MFFSVFVHRVLFPILLFVLYLLLAIIVVVACFATLLLTLRCCSLAWCIVLCLVLLLFIMMHCPRLALSFVIVHHPSPYIVACYDVLFSFGTTITYCDVLPSPCTTNVCCGMSSLTLCCYYLLWCIVFTLHYYYLLWYVVPYLALLLFIMVRHPLLCIVVDLLWFIALAMCCCYFFVVVYHPSPCDAIAYYSASPLWILGHEVSCVIFEIKVGFFFFIQKFCCFVFILHFFFCVDVSGFI